MEQPKEYLAFISYQRKDEAWADRLRKKLEHYRIPSNLRKKNASLPKELRPIFRDALELAGGVLAQEIQTALQQSRFLIVVCSPNSAQSPWVNKEVQTFIDLGRAERIIPFIIDGTPFSGDPATECFPPALRALNDEKELLGININELNRDAATVKVVARMFGLKFDTLWQRYEREQKRKRWTIVGLTMLFALVSLAIGGFIARQNALLKEKDWKMMENQARAVAEKAEELTAQGDLSLAARLLLQVLPSDSLRRPYVAEAERAMRMVADQMDRDSYHPFAAVKGLWGKHVASASFSPDGKHLATTSADGNVSIWDTQSGVRVQTIPANAHSLFYAPEGKRLYVVNDSVSVYETAHYTKESDWPEVRNIARALFSRSGKLMVIVSPSFSCSVWDIGQRKHLFDIPSQRGSSLWKIAISPDDKLLAFKTTSLDYGNGVLFWDIARNQQHRFVSTPQLRSIEFIGPDTLALGLNDFSYRAIYRLNAQTGQMDALLTTPDELGLVDELSYSPEKDILAVTTLPRSQGNQGSSNASITRFWRLSDQQLLATAEGTQNSQRGKIVFSASADDFVFNSQLWKLDAHSVHQLTTWTNYGIDYCREGNYLIMSNACFDCRTWDLVSKWQVPSYGSNKAMSAHYMAEGFAQDGTVQVVEIKTGNIVASFEAHPKNTYFYLTITRDEKHLLVCNYYTGAVEQFNLLTGEKEKVLWQTPQVPDGHTTFGGLVTSPDGRHVGVGYEKDIYCINTASGATESVMSHADKVLSVAFCPRGCHLLSTSSDQSVRVWDLQGNECHKFVANNSLWHPDITADHQYLLASSSNHEAYVWNLSLNEMVHKLPTLTVAYFCNEDSVILTNQDRMLWQWRFSPLADIIDETRNRLNNLSLSKEEKRRYYIE